MPGIIANLTYPKGASVRKLYMSQKAITGTGTFATGLQAIESGTVYVTVANCGTALPFDDAAVTQVSGGSVDVIVIQENGSGHLKETGAIQVNLLAVGR
jgi:hypothetical protein